MVKLILLGARYIEESIPWLVANGKYEEAERILRKAAKVNKVKQIVLLLNLSLSFL